MKTVSRHPLLLGTAVLSLTAGALYGCKDFLEDAAAPQGTLNQETLANRAGVEGALIAAYRSLDWNTGVGGAWGSAASNWVWGSVPGDDAYKGSEASDQPDINDIEAYQWETANSERYLNDKWRAAYEGVVRTNATLRLLARVREQAPGEIPESDARSIEGEALFLRAHYHFEAWRMWGNVPYYREDDTDFRKPNLTSAEVVTSILQDLNAAIAVLPTTPRNRGRVSQWTAKAYKGRVQVYNGQHAEAVTTLGDVRQNGPYALQPSYDQVWTGFTEFENGPETILAYQASANDGEPSGNNANYGERLNFPHGTSHSSCCGFHQPSQNLVNFFAVDAVTGLPAALTNPTWNARDAEFDAGNLTPAVDPRLDWTVGRDGVPYKDWGPHELAWIRSETYGGPYSPKKNAHELASGAESKVGWVPTQLNSVNVHIFRYADMLLLLAEAAVETGDLGTALQIVNQIRERAGVTAQGPGTDRASIAVSPNDPRITWATYRIGQYPGFATQDDARTAVRYERRLELAMEGHRFFDLRRWGIAEQVLNDYVNNVAGGAEENRRLYLRAASLFQSKHRWYPIPDIQIELSKVGGENRLQQNPGW